MIKVNEIFFSIQGESSFAGWPTVFIRTSGCNLRCNYCDTTYAYYDGQKQSAQEIINEVSKHKTKYVCVTGGEPLVQPEVFRLLSDLCDLGYTVSLETSGSISCENVDKRVKKIIDVKTSSSGEGESFLLENLDFANPQDEFKFVICSEQDFEWSQDFIERHKLAERFLVLYSPSFGKIEEKWLANKILSRNSKARLQLQLHKYIWSPESRGV
jgi:7-carboxy-7-deazaguanine synthase